MMHMIFLRSKICFSKHLTKPLLTQSLYISSTQELTHLFNVNEFKVV